jgi:hypothetical protein
MHRLIIPLIMAASIGALWSAPALAYIGPGAGITMLGALWGVVVAIALAIGAVLLWPIRILFRRRKSAAESMDETMEETSEAETSDAGEGR